MLAKRARELSSMPDSISSFVGNALLKRQAIIVPLSPGNLPRAPTLGRCTPSDPELGAGLGLSIKFVLRLSLEPLA